GRRIRNWQAGAAWWICEGKVDRGEPLIFTD
ncbi:MAG: hypothetical protein ACI8T1_003932, partial [Verrucomicrobiales bacterium]